MSDRIGVATLCLHISSAVYLIAGLALLGYYLRPQPTGMPPEVGLICCIVCLAFASGVEVVALGLRRRKYWAWVGGVCISTLYVPTVYAPLGVIGLWALLAPSTRAVFGVAPLNSVSGRPGSSSLAHVAFRWLLLTLILLALATAHAHVSGIGMPPYRPIPEPSEIERIHRLVGSSLFAVVALSAASLALTFVAVVVLRYRRQTT